MFSVPLACRQKRGDYTGRFVGLDRVILSYFVIAGGLIKIPIPVQR